MSTDGVRGSEGGTPDYEALGVRPEKTEQSVLPEVFGWGLMIVLVILLVLAFLANRRQHREELEAANARASAALLDLERCKRAWR